MDVLNFISWVKGSRIVTSVDGSQTLIPLGLRDPKRDDGYLAGAISVADLTSAFAPSYQNNNTRLGEGAIATMTLTTSSVGIGKYALNFSDQNAQSNTAVGYFAGSNMTSTSYGCFFGSNAGRNTSNSAFCVAVGNEAMYYNNNCNDTIAIGQYAGNNIFSAPHNVLIGSYSGRLLQGGENNVYVGSNTATNYSNGDQNVAIGRFALNNNTTGSYNTAIGSSALQNSTTGSSNTIIGHGANTTANGINSSIVLGRAAASDANNQFVVGSTSYNAGAVTTETVSSTRTWTVKINGVDRKILLA